MKKTVIAALMCMGLSSAAFADNYFQYNSNPSGMLVAENPYNSSAAAPNGYTPTLPKINVPPTTGTIGNRLVALDYQALGLDVQLYVNDKLVKNYNVRTDADHQFIIINGEDVPYIKGYSQVKDGKKTYLEPQYSVSQNGLAIRGIAQPNVNGYVNVRLNVIYNDLVGFQKYCPTGQKVCSEIPQELLSENNVAIQAPYNQEIRAAEVRTSQGDRIVVKFTVVPLQR